MLGLVPRLMVWKMERFGRRFYISLVKEWSLLISVLWGTWKFPAKFFAAHEILLLVEKRWLCAGLMYVTFWTSSLSILYISVTDWCWSWWRYGWCWNADQQWRTEPFHRKNVVFLDTSISKHYFGCWKRSCRKCFYLFVVFLLPTTFVGWRLLLLISHVPMNYSAVWMGLTNKPFNGWCQNAVREEQDDEQYRHPKLRAWILSALDASIISKPYISYAHTERRW